ncbi:MULTISPECIES: phosphoribosylglycinamide formyltransferase [unclassified Serratia (in: enterobacteria)]|uniref:phosphoribosylglycinamide formyltransferase n=1 Tax=unclassified Serratia (in: enterobacteria) TaxID=2647522 RepID=UPI000501738D|nr:MULTISPECIES: phosphoribosylglycinamide formyltransferase [unclassified Serratia (in: enterobacteria)]KFK96832.1 phosphoribosylglycinamide formyltransferase [Serratia sp. Ag2]KFK97375.1 phosphoribosylglycinamide formyltransferase [Serratia sp. Ag1]
MKKIVVLVSGQGSNLQALIDACQQGRIAANIVAVFSNKAQAYGLQRAADAGIAAHALDASAFADREAFDAALAAEIDQYQPDLVVLAGYMRILSSAFVQHYAGRMLNIHPSLLPKYPGLHTHKQAIDNGDSEHGTSVHFVTEQLDGGPVILQAKVPIFPGDEEDEVIERVQTQEHRIYPLVVNWFIAGRLAMGDNAAWLDGERLPAQGHAAD